MAYWQRRPQGYVYVYTYEGGRLVALPRRTVKHLDGEPDSNVEAWVRQYQEQWEGKKLKPDQLLYDGSELSRNVKAYLSFLRSRRKSMNTIKQYERMLMRFVIPFFLDGEPALNDPQQWPGKSIRMLPWLEEKDVTPPVINACNKALRSFYRYLSDEGIVQNGLELRLRAPLMEKSSTPLRFTIEPNNVLDFAQSQPRIELKVIALAGYFLSLRPQELFGLRTGDFKAGSAVTSLECSKTMAKLGLYSRLVANVARQKTNRSEIVPPKAGSAGWVTCFHESAARLLVEILKLLEPDEPLLKMNNRRLFKHWHDDGLPDVTIKDLRRASLYWLGHSTGIQPLELMKHARHTAIETTMLYLRRPEEQIEDLQTLDLDA